MLMSETSSCTKATGLAHGRMLHRAPHRQLALYSTHRTPLPALFFSPRKIDAKESSIQTGRAGKEREL
jgi:hypothetical protein